MRRFFDTFGFRMLREGEPDKGGGTGTVDAEKILNQAKGMISSKGAEAAIVTLMTENREYRDKLRDLSGKVPKDGSVVLSADDAKAYDAYKALGAPADVKKLVDEHPVLAGFKASTEKTSNWRAAAKVSGYDPDILTDLVKARDLHVEVKDEKVKTGDKEEMVSTAFVRPASDDKAPLVPLADYVKQHLAPYEGALKAGAQGSAPSGTGNGVQFPRQASTDQGSGGDLIQQRIDAKAKAPTTFNPLYAGAATK